MAELGPVTLVVLQSGTVQVGNEMDLAEAEDAFVLNHP